MLTASTGRNMNGIFRFHCMGPNTKVKSGCMAREGAIN